MFISSFFQTPALFLLASPALASQRSAVLFSVLSVFTRYCLTRRCTSETTIYHVRSESLCQSSLEPHLLHPSGEKHFKVRNCLFWIPPANTRPSPSSVVLSARCSSQRIQTSPVWNLWNLSFCFSILHSLKVTQRFQLEGRRESDRPKQLLCRRTRTCVLRPLFFCLVKQV